VSARTSAAFSILVGLDPLRRGPHPQPAGSRADTTYAGPDTDACIARITATPRSGAMAAAAAARLAPPRTTTPPRRRLRYGAIGLVASAAAAALTTVLWASPSAGSPPDQSANVPAQVGPTHSLPRT
jgi:ferric-dicitrate binding protein FerR (iron transport regulator)